jgi:two-component system response regulator RegA
MHILLIEPDSLQARTYAAAFKRKGHTIAHASGAQSAVSLADEHMPDVVVLELQLPGHNGIEFLYEFRSYPEWLSIPTVIHTFAPVGELQESATLRSQLGVHRILYKPTTTLTALCSAVSAVALART